MAWVVAARPCTALVRARRRCTRRSTSSTRRRGRSGSSPMPRRCVSLNALAEIVVVLPVAMPALTCTNRLCFHLTLNAPPHAEQTELKKREARESKDKLFTFQPTLLRDSKVELEHPTQRSNYDRTEPGLYSRPVCSDHHTIDSPPPHRAARLHRGAPPRAAAAEPTMATTAG